MKKILAVSGGVDSMVMLHLFRRDPDAVVAHFNHGTRPSARADELFVAKKTEEYQLPFYSQKANLGTDVPEEKARTARYAFLSQLAREHSGEIYTAHHLDDLIETIAINLLRGTGWRGLTPLTLHRHPFLEPSTGSDPVDAVDKPWARVDILKYANKHSIRFRQDPTNTEETYLRNRLRQKLSTGSDPVFEKNVFSLWEKQKNLRQQIEKLTAGLLPEDTHTLPKNLFTDPPPEVATELLATALKTRNISLTRPQLADFLHAIATYTPGKRHNLPHDQLVTITSTCIILTSVI